MPIKLNPCAKCRNRELSKHYEMGGCWIVCTECGETAYGDSPDQAQKAWNAQNPEEVQRNE